MWPSLRQVEWTRPSGEARANRSGVRVEFDSPLQFSGARAWRNGRRYGLKNRWGNPCGFESRRPHLGRSGRAALDINWDNVVDTVVGKSLSIGLIVGGLAIALTLSSHLINRAVDRRAIVSKIGLQADEDQKRSETITRVLNTSVRLLLVIVALIMVLSEFGINTSAMIAGLGIAGIAVGFGAQYLVQDYTSGMLIVMENQYRVGDVVTVGGVTGEVEDINLRMTVLRDLDGTVHHVPNGEIRVASNLSKDFARINLDVGVGYGVNLEHLISVVDRVGSELSTDPEWGDRILSPPVFLRVNDFGDSAVEIKIVGETQPLMQWAVTGELRKRLKVAFDREGIEIPFPQRVIHAVPEASEEQAT